MLRRASLILALAACARPAIREGPLLAHSAATELSVRVVEDPAWRHAHPVQVTPRQVREALIGSGRFVDSEVGPFAETLALALGRLAPREALQLSRSAGDYLLYAGPGELRVSEQAAGGRVLVALSIDRPAEPAREPKAPTPPPPAAAPARKPRASSGKSEAQLLSEGIKLREAMKDEEAVAAFEEAYALRHGVEALAQLGNAEMALGRWVDAEAHLDAAIARRDDPWMSEARRQQLTAVLGKIKKRLGSLEVLVNVPGAEVLVDGRPAGTIPLPRPIRVVAGTISVKVSVPGYYPINRQIEVPAEQITRESFDLAQRTGER